jgi:tape measure domain-containing protein
MDLVTVGIGIDSKGAIHSLNQFTGSAHVASNAGDRLEKTGRRVNRMFRGLLAYFGTRQLIEYADTWTLIRARINLVTSSAEQAATVQERLYQIAQRTRNTMAATSVLYTRVALNAGRLGRSHEDLLKMVEAVNSAMLITGATGVEAAQSMRQLSQALGKGKLDGDEFRTVMEAMPEVANAIAKELGVAHGELYRFAREGKILANDVVGALINAHEDLTGRAANIPVTIGQSMVIFQNAATRMIGVLNTASGASAWLSKGIVGLANNMDRLVAVLGTAAAMWITYRTLLVMVATTQAIVTSIKSIAAMLQMAIAIRQAADATKLWSVHSKTIVGLIVSIASVTIGIIAYRKILEEINEETEKWIANSANLDDVIGALEIVPDPDALKKAQRVRWEIEDMIRLANQQVVLASRQGREEKRLGIVFDAVNKRIEARRELTGSLLTEMLDAIDQERNLLLMAENIAAGLDAVNAKLKEQQRIFEQFAENLQNTFADTFFDIMNGGIQRFSDLFKTIKNLFLRMLADMMAAEAMKKFGTQLAGALSGIFAGASAVNAAKESVLSVEELEAIAAATAGGIKLRGQYTPEVNVSNWSVLANMLAPLFAGFAVGSAVGSLTTNRALGTAGGAASGAVTGAIIGSVIPVVGTLVGGIVGGIAGAIGGFLGSSKKQREELEKHRKVLEDNNKALLKLREAVYGSNAGETMGIAQTAIRAALAGRATATQVELLKRVAEELGITLDGSRAALLNLQTAIHLSVRAMTQFGRTIQDIQQRQEAYNKLFDVEKTPQQSLMDTFELLSEMAPDLMRQLGLTNLDLTTEIGRNVLLEGLREIYNMIMGGLLSPDLLGAFTDKNQLIDAVLRVRDAMNELHGELYKVTTDFPRAMDIIYYEQKFGKYGGGRIGGGSDGANGSPGERPTRSFTVHGGVTIQHYGGESGEEILEKVEDAVTARHARGGQTYIV